MKNEDIKDMNNGKRFSVVLMNPPFSGNLHLKFLEKTIEISDIVINISPGGFIFDLGIYNNTKEKTKNVLPHLYKYEKIDWREGNDLFDTGNGIMSNLHIGIYKHDYTNGEADINKLQNEIYEKIRYTFKTNLRKKFIPKNDLSKYGLRIFRYHYDPTQEAFQNIVCFAGKAVAGIDFNNKNEQQNFIDSLKTWPYKFMNKLGDTNPAHLPWLEDYTKQYNDDDMDNIFNITKEEKEYIEKFLSK